MTNKMDWTKKFVATNNGERVGKIIAGILDIPYGETVLINPMNYHKEVLNTLKEFAADGQLEVSNNTSSYEKPQMREFATAQIKTAHNEHVVYNGDKAINVYPIDTGNKAITVDENYLDNNSKAIEVTSEPVKQQEPPFTKTQAQELLNLHWKTFEVEVNKIEDQRKLNLLAVVAVEVNAAEKKRQIIADRTNELA
jgi:hypothetical protein